MQSEEGAIDYKNNTITVRNVPREILHKNNKKGSAIQVITGKNTVQDLAFIIFQNMTGMEIC